MANTFAGKAGVAFVAIAMALMMVAPAQAQTAEELQAQIDALMAQIAGLTAAPAASTSAYVFTRSLTIGSQGADVTALQTYLIAGGYAIPAGATGYFGAQTAAAVAAWQTANGIMPAAGYFGPVSQAKYAALMAATPADDSDDDSSDDDADDSDDDTSADLGDGEGSIASFDEVSSDDSNINEGEVGEIFAFTAEIEGDVEINRVDFYLDSTAAGSQSENADDYFSGATLWVDGEEVGSIDVEDFDEDSYAEVTSPVGDADEYRLRFSGLEVVGADGDEPEFVLALEANGSIDSTDLTEDWGVSLAADSVRFVDGEGFSDDDGADLEESFGFDAEEASELKVSESEDNPDASTLEVDDEDNSDELAVLMFEIEEKNGVDATVEDLTVTITTSATNESTVLSEAKIFNGSEELGSESVTNGGVINFENLGLEIAADETVELTVKVVANGADDYGEGTTTTAVFTSIDSAEDANGNDESDMTISGSADGNTHTLRSTGISVEVTSADTTINAEDGAANDQVEFTWDLTIKAFGNDDVYINKDIADIVTSGASGDVDQIFAITVSTGSTTTGVGGTIVTNSSADDISADASAYSAAYSGETFYKISNEETFTITVSGTNVTNSKQIRAALSDIEWTTDDITAATAQDASTATINSYTDNLADDSETPFKTIN